ncbi:MAG TPA: flagellar biosynthesis protein FlhF [Bacillales bacterium]|nr:flagellar biosynthesis protein FlhF [Bacillales bacterium]
MKIKKFTAPTMPEAMKLIRKSLGTDAIILHSKEVDKGGFFGFFAKKHLEVIAAVDPDGQPNEPRSKQPQPIANGTAFSERFDLEWLEGELRQLKAPQYPGPLAQIHDFLVDHEIEPKYTDSFMQDLLKTWYRQEEAMKKPELYRKLHELLVERLEQNEGLPFRYEKKYLVFAGPTGVGKTTSLAKIAAKAKIDEGKSIAFITADTYRIAAVDQLKAYADILNVPIEVAYTKEDFRKAKKMFADRDLVLIDTAGRNYKQSTYIDELKSLISFGADTETWLVLAATAKYNDMRSIVNKFRSLPPDRLVFTKTDETTRYGTLVNLSLSERLQPEFITNGQNVPDDLVKATPRRIAGMVTGVETDA